MLPTKKKLKKKRCSRLLQIEMNAFSIRPWWFILFRLQDGLRRRMDKLKSSIEETNQAADRERQKNVSLLHLIFPPDIAKRLWLGK